MKKLLILAAVLFVFIFTLSSLEEVQFSFYPGDRFVLTEKQDLRMRQNGRYQGFIYREIRSSLGLKESGPGAAEYSGTSYMFQEMKRDAALLGRRVENSSAITIVLESDGGYRLPPDQLFPLLRSVPRFPSEPVEPGDSWRVSGERMVRARDGSPYTRVPLYIEYRYQGEMGSGDTAYHALTAQYALRYRQGDDPKGDHRISRISGSHKLDIRIPVHQPEKIFMRDTVEEQYLMTDGTEYTYSGIILTWFDSPVDYDRREVIRRIVEADDDFTPDDPDPGLPPGLGEVPAEEGLLIPEGGLEEGGVVITESGEGLMLSLPDIHFIADSPRILPDEAPRLDLLARALKAAGEATILIRGHTADVGSRESQIELSYQRAKTILDEMAARGIPPARMIYEGKGGEQPVAPNNTEEGRRQNRRVEVILLD
jgi:OmpA-OmpF porin, OOP family